MSRPRLVRYGLWHIAIWLVAFAAPSQADLTGPTVVVPIADYVAADATEEMPLALDSNHVTGEYVVCYAFKVGFPNFTINCSRFDATNQLLSTSQAEMPGVGPLESAEIEATLNDQGQVFALWLQPQAPSRSYLVGFDSDGSELFTPVDLPGAWLDVSVAVSPNYVWVGGWQQFPLDGTDSLLLTTFRFTPAGIFMDEVVHYQQDWDPSGLCRGSDLVSTPTGHLLLTWDLPATPGGCLGTVWASTFLENRAIVASDIQLSEDDTGNEHPNATAYANGEFVVSWLSLGTLVQMQTSAVTFGGTIAIGPDNILPIEAGAPSRIAGFSHNKDYFAVSSVGHPDTDCFLRARLVFFGDPDPDASFLPGFCSMGFDVAFNEMGDMMLARFSDPDFTQPGQLQVEIFPRPAEIEIADISVTEGSPQKRIGNNATLTASLTRAHPLGEDIAISFFTNDSTAISGVDYQQTSDTLIFDGALAETAKNIQIPIMPDTDYEADEIFTVNLTGAFNAVVRNGMGTANVTIINDDFSPPVLADCDGGDPTNCRQVQELGPGEFSETLITLTMAQPVSLPVSIDYATQQGGPDPTRLATPGTDFADVSGTLQIPAGATQASFNITVFGDDVPEDTETFQVVLSGGSFIDLPETVLTISILDDVLCFIELDTTGMVFEMEGGTLPLELTTLDNTCQWESTADDAWVSLDPANGSGSQSVQVTAEPWEPMGQITRSTEVTIELTGGAGSGSATLIIDQNGDCDFTIDASSASFDAGGGTGSITVTPSDPACDWFVFTDETWINITSPTVPVTGSGTVQYSVSSNGSTNVENDPRMATLISEEFSYEITQDGCVYDVDPSAVSVEAAGNDAVNVNVTAGPAACQWSAVSNSTWIFVESGASGSGNGSVVLDVIENPSVVPRMGSITIADELVTFEQAGQPCDISASPANLIFCPDGEGFAIDVSANAGCGWSLVSQDDWVSIVANATGDGDETAMGLVDVNLSEIGRASTVDLIATESGLSVDTVAIQQQGFLEYEPFDGSLPADWVFDPMGAFSIADGYLVAALSGGGTGLAVHQNPLGSCSDCKVESTIEVTSVISQSQDVATLLGWYISDNDYVGLGMDEFANTWSLYQVSGGVVVESGSTMVPQILPNQPYDLEIRFDGAEFSGFVDGIEMVSITLHPGTDPSGFAGFMISDSNVRFTELRVTGVFQDSNIVLSDSFETPVVVPQSVCTQL